MHRWIPTLIVLSPCTIWHPICFNASAAPLANLMWCKLFLPLYGANPCTTTHHHASTCSPVNHCLMLDAPTCHWIPWSKAKIVRIGPHLIGISASNVAPPYPLMYGPLLQNVPERHKRWIPLCTSGDATTVLLLHDHCAPHNWGEPSTQYKALSSDLSMPPPPTNSYQSMFIILQLHAKPTCSNKMGSLHAPVSTQPVTNVDGDLKVCGCLVTGSVTPPILSLAISMMGWGIPYGSQQLSSCISSIW